MSVAFDPKGKTFKERLDAFHQDAKDTHNLTVRADNGRTVEWQHMHHVAHMFLYNSYLTTKPLNADKSKRTIAWEHISDPKLQWNTIKWDDFLKKKQNRSPSNWTMFGNLVMSPIRAQQKKMPGPYREMPRSVIVARPW